MVGGVTSTTAEFRVRGPSSDDGKAREFVVSTNANLAIEKDQILNIPVSYGDFEPEEHYMKRLSLDDLDPLTPYFYGITRPKRTPNSAVVAGDVGTFVTPGECLVMQDYVAILYNIVLILFSFGTTLFASAILFTYHLMYQLLLVLEWILQLPPVHAHSLDPMLICLRMY